MNLPPLTFTEAANLYKRIVESDGDVVMLAVLAADPAEMLVHLASALVVFGKQLERDQQVILEQKDSIEELNAHLRAYLDDHLAGRLESDLSDEALVAVYDEFGNLLATAKRKDVHPQTLAVVDEFDDQIRNYDPGTPYRQPPSSYVTGVEWRGPVKNYFDHYEEIIGGLAKGISEMARQQVEDQDKRAE